MNAIILAAGEGTRLKRYTRDMPKGMLILHGKTLIQHQIERFRRCGLGGIAVVRGYRGARIDYPGVHYVDNDRWQETSMVHSLMCAAEYFQGGAIVSYGDVFFGDALLRAVLQCPGGVAAAVDVAWQSYWQRRYGRLDFDTEGLELDPPDTIRTLGAPGAAISDIDARFIGVMKFSEEMLAQVRAIHAQASRSHWNAPWQHSGKPFRQAYMTDLLQELIDRGQRVRAVPVRGGWLEFDTAEDYERQRNWPIEELQ